MSHFEALRNAVRRDIARALRDRGKTLHGIISAYDSTTYRAKVMLQPDNVESNWLPIGSLWVGNGWGMLAPPADGTQVQIAFQEEDKDSGVIALNLFDDAHLPPVGSPAVAQGELLLFQEGGQYIKLDANGNIILNCTVQIQAGNAGETLYGLLMKTFTTFFNSHTHGGGDVPDQTLDDTYYTSVLKAN